MKINKYHTASGKEFCEYKRLFSPEAEQLFTFLPEELVREAVDVINQEIWITVLFESNTGILNDCQSLFKN